MDQGKQEKRLVTNTLILLIGTLFSSVFSFFIVPFYSRWLSASDYGIYDLFVTYVSLLQPVLTLSCGEACFRFLLERREEQEKNSTIGQTFVISIIGLMVGSVVVVFLFVFGKQSYLLPFVCLLFTSTMFVQCGYIARGLRKPAVYTMANIIYLLSMAASVTIMVYFMNMGAAGILFGSSIGYCCGSLYAISSCGIWKSLYRFRLETNIVKGLVAYSIPLIPNTISWWIVGVSDRSLVSLFLGPAVNGVYAIASKVPSLCTTMFGVFHMSWQESASDAINDNERSIYFNRVFNRIVPLCLCLCMCVLSVNRYMYRFIWDEKYIDGYYHVPILITAAIFSFLAQFLGGVLVALKKTKINGTTTVAAACINVVFNFMLIRIIGLYAASMSTLASYFILFFIRAILIRKDFRIKVNKRVPVMLLMYTAVICSQFSTSEMVGAVTVVFSIAVTLLLNKNIIDGLFCKILKRR